MSAAKKLKFDNIEIPGVELVDSLGQGNYSRVFRARDLQSGECYACKVAKENPLAPQLFTLEANYLASINSPYIVNIYHQGIANETHFLLLENLQGKTLAQWLKENKPDFDQSIQIFKQITRGLYDLHAQGYVHRDLKPANIMIDEKLNIKIIDLGLADNKLSAPKENEERDVVGSFLYASPEQLGATLHPTDHRSDLYSLGVILFELLTGHLPFIDSNFTNLINWHTSGSYPNFEALRDQVDFFYVDLLIQLLKKDPNDRPQSANEVLFDVDPRFSVDINKHFVGRERERSEINELLEKLKQKKNTLSVLVNGGPGSGKSYLIDQCLSIHSQKEFLKISVKCEQNNSLPFFTLQEWSKQLVRNPESRSILSKNHLIEGELDIARIAILKKTFPYLAQILKQDTSNWLGEASGVSEVYEAFACLLKILSKHAKLILYIDDIQWIDKESANFLKSVSTSLNKLPCLFIFAARNDEVSQQKVSELKEFILSEEHRIIDLEGLSIDHTSQLIQNLLGRRAVEDKIIDLVAKRTEGNAFAIKEFVKSMQDNQWVEYHWNKWSLNKEKGENINLPNTVVDILLQKINQLSANTKKILSIASLAGNTFKVDHLKGYMDLGAEQIVETLNEALQKRLIEKKDKGEYSFIHDRVLEAFNQTINEQEQKKIHFHIASELKKEEGERSIDEVFSLMEHLIKSSNHAKPKDLIQWGNLAAEKALDSHLPAECKRYLDYVFIASSQLNTTVNYKTHALAGEASLRLGLFTKTLVQFEKAIDLCDDANIRVTYRLMILKALFSAIDLTNPAMQKHMNGILDDLGEWKFGFYKLAPVFVFFAMIFNFLGIWAWWPKRTFKQKKLSELQNLTGLLTFHEAEFNKGIYYSWWSYFTANRAGPSLELAKAANQAGIAFATAGLKSAAAYMKKKGRKIAEQFVDRRLNAECDFYAAIIDYLLGEPHKASIQLKEVLKKKGHYLHSIDYLNAKFAHIWNEGSRGHMRLFVNEFYSAKDYVKTQQGIADFSKAIFDSHEIVVNEIKGDTFSEVQLSLDSENVLNLIKQNKYVAGAVISNILLRDVIRGNLKEHEVDKLVEAFEQHCKVGPMFIIMTPPINFYIWQIMAYARMFYDHPESSSLEKKFKKAIFQMSISGFQHPTFKAYHLLYKGVYYLAKKNYIKANRFLFKSLHLAKTINHHWVEMECYYYLHQNYLAQEIKDPSDIETLSVIKLATRYGLEFRLRSMHLEIDPEVNSTKTLADSSSTIMVNQVSSSSALSKSWNLHGQKQFQALKKLSISLSPVLDENEQHDISLQTIMETLGAERGFLFSVIEGKPNLVKSLNRSGNDLQEDNSFSQSVVNHVLKTQDAVVYTGSTMNSPIQTESIFAKDIRSIICAPLILGDKFLGVVYLDNRLIRGAFTEKDIELLQAMANMVAFSLEMSQKAQLEIAKNELERDLEVSGAVQKLLIPAKSHRICEHFEYSFHFEPAAKAGGDWIWTDHHPTRPDINMLIGDVTGHGIGSAMISSLVAGVLNCNWREHGSMEKVFRAIHKNLKSITNESYLMSCTGFYLDAETSKATLFCAGAPPILVLRGSECLVWGESGSILGLEDLDLGIEINEILPGDRIVAFSDGLYEAENLRGRQYGLAKFRRYLLKQPLGLDADELKDEILKEIKTWTRGHELKDDLTFIVLDYKKGA